VFKKIRFLMIGNTEVPGSCSRPENSVCFPLLLLMSAPQQRKAIAYRLSWGHFWPQAFVRIISLYREEP
jgi:hypothetical protein